MKDSIYKSFTLADKVYIIDNVITREVEWSDDSTEDIQNAWVDIKNILKDRANEKS